MLRPVLSIKFCFTYVLHCPHGCSACPAFCMSYLTALVVAPIGTPCAHECCVGCSVRSPNSCLAVDRHLSGAHH